MPDVLGLKTHVDKMGDDAVKLFIGQVPREWGENELRETFEKYGEIAHMKIITDRESGRPKG